MVEKISLPSRSLVATSVGNIPTMITSRRFATYSPSHLVVSTMGDEVKDLDTEHCQTLSVA